MDEIAAGVADEGIADVFGAPGVAAEDGDAGGAGEISGGAAAAFDGAGDQAAYAPHGAGIEGKIFAADIHRVQQMYPRGDLASISSARSMNPIVQTPVKAVEQLLHIEPRSSIAKSGEHHAAVIGDAIPVSILQVNNV